MNMLINKVATTVPLHLPSLLLVAFVSAGVATLFVMVSPGIGALLAVGMCAVAKAHSDRRVAAGLDNPPRPNPQWPAVCLIGAVCLDVYALAVLFGVAGIHGADRILVPAACALASAWLIKTFAAELTTRVANVLLGRAKR